MTAATAKKIEPFKLIEGQAVDIPLDLIDADPDQPRKEFDDDYIKVLGQDIKAKGLDYPVLLRAHPTAPGRFMLFDGENRVRACRRVNLESIAALPYKEPKGKNAALEIFLGQFKTTTNRRDLNPMEYAMVIDKLATVFGMTQVKIEDTFKKFNIANIGRSQISNLSLLNRLPEWAQNRIRSREITPAHGKHLVGALVSDKVMATIKKKFELTDDGWQPSEKELQQEIYFTFLREHVELDSHHVIFDTAKACKGCRKKKGISNHNGNKATVCMDRQCFAQFQAQAEKEKQKEQDPAATGGGGAGGAGAPAPLQFEDDKPTPTGQFDILAATQARPLGACMFNTAECKKCQHRKVDFNKEEFEADQKAGDDVKREDYETELCHHPICYDTKLRDATIAMSTARRLMADTLAKRLADEPKLAARLMVWVASGCPAGITQHDDKDLETLEVMPLELYNDDVFESLLFKRSLTSPAQFLMAEDVAFVSLAEYTLHQLAEDDYRQLIDHLKIKVTDFQVDEIYIASLASRDMLELIGQTDLPIAICNEFDGCAKLDVKELRDLMFKHIKHFKAPAKDIQFAFKLLMSG